jgi:heme/copper-type cytochrome/quinol oxidase subunit 1
MVSINKKVLILMGAAALLLSFLIVTLMLFFNYREEKSVKEAEQKKMAYDMSILSQTTKSKNRSELIYPEVIEEQDLSIDPYRERDFKWTADEVSRLWIEPDAGDIDYFTDANHKLVWDILKDAP